MLLYHVDVYLPPTFIAPTHIVAPKYSRHAQDAANTDRYGKMMLPKTVNLAKCQVVEIGIENGKVVKILVRGQYNSDLDLCMVFIPNSGREWFVKTVWFNERTDDHRTLNISKYATA